MNEPENFLQRWSRRKQEAADSHFAQAQAEPTAAAPAPPPATGEEPAAAPQALAESFDLADLPSIDSIGADTDIRDFLRAGVPADLRREALRRAWSTDPKVRDFVGLVENGWDFNDPEAMPGFGTIDPSEVARLVEQVTGVLKSPEREQSVAVASSPQATEPVSEAADDVAVQRPAKEENEQHVDSIDRAGPDAASQ